MPSLHDQRVAEAPADLRTHPTESRARTETVRLMLWAPFRIGALLLLSSVGVSGALAGAAGFAFAQTLSPDSVAPSLVAGSGAPDNNEACGGGFLPDDGTVETGYGWVPSVVDGRYVQRFTLEELAPSRYLDEICVCWIRTRTDSDITFSLELYSDEDGVPALTPSWSRTVQSFEIPEGVPGGYSSFATDQLLLSEPVFYVGVSWDPSSEDFFFVCADTSEQTPARELFFLDDRAEEWTSAFETLDPLFGPHRALGVRLTPRTAAVDIPISSPVSLAALIGLLGLVGFFLLRSGG